MNNTGCRNSARRIRRGIGRILTLMLALLFLVQLMPATAHADPGTAGEVYASVHRHGQSCYDTAPETGEQVLICAIPEQDASEEGAWLAGELSGALKELEQGGSILAISGGQIAADGTYSATVTATKVKDGKTYTGTVYVTVEDGKIGGLSIYAKDKNDRFQDALYKIMYDLIGKAASPDAVDAVSSASLSGTGGSKYTMDLLPAIRRALESADPAPDSGSIVDATPVADGVYRGTCAMANGHSITLDVTVRDGAIATLAIAEADGSWDSLLGTESANYVGKTAAIEVVDAVSSATSLSYREAIKNAILDALGGAALTEPDDPQEPQESQEPEQPAQPAETGAGKGLSLSKSVNVTDVVETTEVSLELEALSTARQVVTGTVGEGANIVMVIDTSGSIIGKEAALNKAIQSLAASLPEGSQIGEVVFNDSATAGTIYTKETISRLSFSGTDGAGTVMANGNDNAWTLLNGSGWQNSGNNKAIVLISDFDVDDHTNAINSAKTAKSGGYSVFCVKIDSSAVQQNVTMTELSTDDRANSVPAFTAYVSSNYPDASAVNNSMFGLFNQASVTPGSATTGYCFGAAGGDWGRIFSAIQQSVISYETVSLGSAAIFRDRVNTEIFDLTDATAALAIFDYADGTWTALPGGISARCGGSAALTSWQGKAAGDGRIELRFTADGTVDITGFSYRDHYLPESGEEAEGVDAQKLHLTISGLKPKDGVRTEEDRNDVPTNVENVSGLYADGSAEEPEMCFPLPHVNIPAKEPVEPSVLYGCSLSPRGNIAMNFYLILTEEALADEGAYVEMNGTRYPLAQAEARQVNDQTMHRFTCEMPAKQMNDAVTLRLFGSDGTPLPFARRDQDITQTGYPFTIHDYIELTREQSDDPLLVALVEAMSDYGSCAQAHFRYDTDSRAAILGDLESVTAEDLAGYAPKLSTSGHSGLTYLGSSLVLRSETAIRHYFSLDEGEIGDYSFKVGGKELTPVQGDQGWYVEIPDIYARYLDKTYVLTASGAEGKIFTLRYSALSYAKNVLEKNEDPTLMDLARAVFRYSQAADAYFDSLNG